MKGKALRKHSLYEKTAASVLGFVTMDVWVDPEIPATVLLSVKQLDISLPLSTTTETIPALAITGPSESLLPRLFVPSECSDTEYWKEGKYKNI